MEKNTVGYPTLKQTWGYLGIALLVILAIYGALLIIMLAGILTVGQERILQLFSHSLTMLILYILWFAAVIWIGLAKKRKHEGQYVPDFSMPAAFNILFIALGTLGIYFLVDPLVDLIPMPEFIEKIFLSLMKQDVWKVVLVVGLAPLCEEVIFRGIILDGLLKVYSPKKAIIWSALFFGIFHLNPWQFIAGFALGIYMGWVYYRTKSLMSTIFVHFIANGTSTLLGFLLAPHADKIVPTHEFFGNNLLYVLFLAASFLVAATSIFFLNQTLKPTKTTT